MNPASSFYANGYWPTSTSIPGYYGSSYRYNPPGSGANEAVWHFDVMSGEYEISAQWSSFSKSRIQCRLLLFYNNGVKLGTVHVDQRYNGGKFNLLASLTIENGDVTVVLTDTADGYVIADAVKISYLGPASNQRPEGVIDVPSGDMTIRNRGNDIFFRNRDGSRC